LSPCSLEQISKEKDSKTGAEARLKEDLEEREEELLKQVEETKRVETALRSKEKELYALKVRRSHSSPLSCLAIISLTRSPSVLPSIENPRRSSSSPERTSQS